MGSDAAADDRGIGGGMDGFLLRGNLAFALHKREGEKEGGVDEKEHT